jgi:hypothetical protein
MDLTEKLLATPPDAPTAAAAKLTTTNNDGPKSLQDLQKGNNISGDCGSDPTVKPKWLNKDVYEPAQIKSFFEKNIFSIVLAWHCSLTIGFSLPTLLSALVYTERSNTKKKALKRYLNTGSHLSSWHMDDIFDPTTKSFTSIQFVRSLHESVRQRMNTAKPGQTWLSMYNMACVQSGFMGAITILPSKFALRGTNEELEKYVSFWKCVGYQLGVTDEFNLCSLGLKYSDPIVWEIIDQVLIPDNQNPPEEYDEIASAYIGGLNLLVCGLPFFSVKSSVAYTYYGLGRKLPKMCICDYIRFCLLRLIVLLIAYNSPFRYIVNKATERVMKTLVHKKMEMDMHDLSAAIWCNCNMSPLGLVFMILFLCIVLFSVSIIFLGYQSFYV